MDLVVDQPQCGGVGMRALSVPFTIGHTRNVASTSNYEAIVRGQVVDALMTNQGERVFRPRYGCDIQAALFDPVDELVRRDAASYIMRRLEQFVSRATIRFVTVKRGDEVGMSPNYVLVDVTYRTNPLAPDVTVSVPVSSEFLNRQIARELREGVRPQPDFEEAP